MFFYDSNIYTNLHCTCSFKGQSPLVFEDKVVYLAMDWRNNPKEKDSVVVTPKETMVRV